MVIKQSRIFFWDCKFNLSKAYFCFIWGKGGLKKANYCSHNTSTIPKLQKCQSTLSSKKNGKKKFVLLSVYHSLSASIDILLVFMMILFLRTRNYYNPKLFIIEFLLCTKLPLAFFLGISFFK